MTRPISNSTFEAVRAGVVECLGGDDSGHGMDHIDRVEAMTMHFSKHFEGRIDAQVARLAALLHDVDDYKLVGRHKAGLLVNATAIMERAGIDSVTQQAVKDIVATIGSSTALAGIRQTMLEGMVVSDADMLDAAGVTGVVRALQYAVSGYCN